MTPPGQSSAEKRVLWEVRQRYHVDGTARPTRPLTRPLGGSSGVGLPPPRTRGSFGRARGSHPGRWGRRIVLTVVLLVLLFSGIFGYKILAASNKITTTDRSILGQLKDLLFTQGKILGGETDDRINILLIAIGGQGHSGQNLADTIMVASLRPSDHAVGLMSIPRDFYAQVPDENYFTKINAVHAYGESKKKGSGPLLVRQKVEEITGQPMNYYARIDFIAFKQIVDAVGGVNITIDNSFFDYWHKIAFSTGTETMNGERALAYVRARYIEGPEGGDFKRAARQQQMLLALREKVFSVNTAFDFGAANTILNSLSDNIRTDMELWEMKRFYEIARQVDRDKVNSVVLTTGPRGVLVGTTEVLSGVPASVLKPRTGDYAEIQGLMQNIFAHADAPVQSPAAGPETSVQPSASPSPSPSPSPATTPISVEVRNGTNITGLAKEVSGTLAQKGYAIAAVGNAATRNNEHTTVYALRQDDESQAKAIAELLEARADVDLPEGEAASSAQVVVILGEDAKE